MNISKNHTACITFFCTFFCSFSFFGDFFCQFWFRFQLLTELFIFTQRLTSHSLEVKFFFEILPGALLTAITLHLRVNELNSWALQHVVTPSTTKNASLRFQNVQANENQVLVLGADHIQSGSHVVEVCFLHSKFYFIT